MKKKVTVISVSLIVVIAIAVAIIFVLKGANGYRQIKVEEADGDVTITRDRKEIDAVEGMKLISEDHILVDEDSSLALLVDDDKHVVAEENTEFEIVATGSARKGEVKIELIGGKALFTIDNKLPDDSKFSVLTANATMSVRGTEFEVYYDAEHDVTTLQVNKGVVKVNYDGDFDSEEVEAGESRVFSDDERYEGSIKDGLDKILGIASEFEGDQPGGDVSYADFSFDGYEGNVIGQYNYVISNWQQYLSEGYGISCDQYYKTDYMYYDYDKDGEKEVILYLGYDADDGKWYRDVYFLDYSYDKDCVYKRGCSNYELDEASFYCEYDGQLARYSWASVNESYLYVVAINGEGHIIFVLEEYYDYLISGLEDAGMYALPLYGVWEPIFE